MWIGANVYGVGVTTLPLLLLGTPQWQLNFKCLSDPVSTFILILPGPCAPSALQPVLLMSQKLVSSLRSLSIEGKLLEGRDCFFAYSWPSTLGMAEHSGCDCYLLGFPMAPGQAACFKSYLPRICFFLFIFFFILLHFSCLVPLI